MPPPSGAPLVKGLPVNPTDPSVTGPDIFSKLVPMAAHEASSLYRWVGGSGAVSHTRLCCRCSTKGSSVKPSGLPSQRGQQPLQAAAHPAVLSVFSEEKAKLLREVMAKIDSKNETLE